MKKVTFICMLVVVMVITSVMPVLGQRGDDTNRKSKNGKVEGTVGGAAVVLEYGSPKVNGRTIWGELVPYDAVWRTGADEATTFTVDKAVTVEGQALAAGSYSLFTIPGKEEWTVIFNKTAKQWGAYKYDEGQDVLRVKVKPVVAEYMEAMTFQIDGNKVVLRWEKLAVPFVIGAAMH